ncbi:MAG: hypothetical protein CMJ12_00310 [Pelagibacterales bacterium]|nr:hypothetical protein [Pelagibacterales bacterium]PPR16441.1 MAG: hypothetical protein CFH33_00691 [Alphaproteobacteria bacterium MarineAlpha9_Bin3]
MVKFREVIIFLLIILLPFYNIAYSIESAAHKVEVAKCFGVIMTIKNNSKNKDNIEKANNIVELYLDKIINLNIGSIMMKEMSEKAAEEVFTDLKSYPSTYFDTLLNKCINTLRIG